MTTPLPADEGMGVKPLPTVQKMDGAGRAAAVVIQPVGAGSPAEAAQPNPAYRPDVLVQGVEGAMNTANKISWF